MKIIFGGSFNPPTIAHKEIYKYLESNLGFDSFYYLPVSNKYKKDGLIENELRVEMLKLLIKDLPKAKIDYREVDSNEYKGTYDLLRSENKDTYFLIGSDNLRDLENWINFEKLVSERKFIVINRNNSNDLDYIKNHPFLNNYIDNFIIISGFNLNISSSDFRLNNNDNVLTNEVKTFIRENNLYGGKA